MRAPRAAPAPAPAPVAASALCMLALLCMHAPSTYGFTSTFPAFSRLQLTASRRTSVQMNTWVQSLTDTFSSTLGARQKGTIIKRVAITGAGGLIGTALTKHLKEGGSEVLRITTRPSEDVDTVGWSIDGGLDASVFEGVDAVVHLAGESISSIGLGGWSKTSKQKILQSRLKGTKLVVDAINSLEKKPKVLVTASAVGYYGYNNFGSLFDESGPKGSGFLADVVEQWEGQAREVSKDVRLVNARFGVVLSKDGGIVNKLKPLFALGAGGNLGSGAQPMSWVSIGDAVRALEYLVRNDISGPVNVCSPNPCTNAEFTSALGKALYRPTIVPLPAVVARTLFGDVAEELLLGGQKCVPKKLLRAGFEFQEDVIDDAMVKILRS